MSANKQTNWSKPYCSVQHLSGLKRGFQITVTNWNSFADCAVFVPGCGFSATHTDHETIEQAIEHGEKQAALLDAFGVRAPSL
jgi:hypothetical protein